MMDSQSEIKRSFLFSQIYKTTEQNNFKVGSAGML